MAAATPIPSAWLAAAEAAACDMRPFAGTYPVTA
jgi:hypothetical protein